MRRAALTKSNNRSPDIVSKSVKGITDETTQPKTMATKSNQTGNVNPDQETSKQSNAKPDHGKQKQKGVVIDAMPSFSDGTENQNSPTVYEEDESTSKGASSTTLTNTTGDVGQKGYKKKGSLDSLDEFGVSPMKSSSRSGVDEFGVSSLSFGTAGSLTYKLGKKSFTMKDGGDFISAELNLKDNAGRTTEAGNVKHDTMDGKKEKDDDDDDDAESIRSHGSHSVYSEKIKKASRRGERRAHKQHSSSQSLDGSEMKSRKKDSKRKRKKKKKSDKQRSKIHDMIGQSADTAVKVQFENMPKNITDEEEDDNLSTAIAPGGTGVMDLPSTSNPLSPYDFDYDPAEVAGGSRGSTESNFSKMSRTSALAADKYHNKQYLAGAAGSKFQKGLHCTRKKRYALARMKFRAALKARILLHEDIRHLSIAPVHEMIGLVERKLQEYEKSMLHLLAALEICEGAMERLEEEDERERNESLMLVGKAGKGGRRLGLPKLEEEEENGAGSAATTADSKMKSSQTTQLDRSSVDGTAHIGDLDMTNSPPTIEEQRQMLQTNIDRIKKTMEVVKNNTLKKKAQDLEKSNATTVPGAYRKGSFDNSPVEQVTPGEEADDDTDAAAAALGGVIASKKVSEEDKIQAWAEKLDKPEIIYKSAEDLVMETLNQKELDVAQLASIEEKAENKNDEEGGQIRISDITFDSSMDEMERSESDDNNVVSNDKELFDLRFSWGLDSIEEGDMDGSASERELRRDGNAKHLEGPDTAQGKAETASASAAMASQAGNARAELLERPDEAATSSNDMIEDVDEVMDPDGMDPRASWGLDSIEEEKERAMAFIEGESPLKEHTQPQPQTEPEEDSDVSSEISHPPIIYQPKSKHGQGIPVQMTFQRKPLYQMKRMSTYCEDRLRSTYQNESKKGEEYYNHKQYVMAVGSFNDAKFALLIITGMPDEKSQRDNPTAVNYAKLRDQINSALLSERITDCHVEKFFRLGRFDQETTDDFSHVNYRQAATMLADTKKVLLQQIHFHFDGVKKQEVEQLKPGLLYARECVDSLEEEKNAEVNDLKDLVKEATLSMARIYSKQGCVYAKLDNHYTALDLFGDSLTAWEEDASLRNETKFKPQDRNDNLDLLAVSDDSLILETHDMIRSYYETRGNTSKLSSGAHSLKSTVNAKAMYTALQMATSHHALGVEVLNHETNDNLDQLQEAVDHHLHALKYARETERLRAAFNIRSLLGNSKGSKPRSTFVGAAMSVVSGGRRITTRSRDLSVLMTQSDSKEMISNIGTFMKRCTLLQTQQQICLSRACFWLGLHSLSKKWLMKAVDSMDDLGLFDAKDEADIAMYIQSVMVAEFNASDVSQRALSEETLSLDNLFSLYDGGLAAISLGNEEQPRLLIHYALATLKKGLHMDARDMFQQAVHQICKTPDSPPEYYHEVLHAIDAQIIIEVKEGNIAGALVEVNRRLDLVSKWIGNRSLAIARDLHRLACFQSVLGNHEKCVKRLDESLHIGSSFSEYDTLDSMTLLATAHDVMNDVGSAISEYECALAMEEDLIRKAKLINALAHLHVRAGGQCHLAVEYLDKSLGIQKGVARSDESEDTDLLMDTMILYGNVMASKHSYTEAIYWYESALNSNPDKSTAHPNNLRALYNKGVSLFRSGDIIGAGHAFGGILDEVEKNTTMAPGSAFVLNAIGSIYFANEDYDGAIERFKETLYLKNGDLTQCQRAKTLCNIATAYYKLGKDEESEINFNKALRTAEGDDTPGTKRMILSKFAFTLYKRKLYLRAQDLFTHAASVGNNSEDHDYQFSNKCEGYAETCRLRLIELKYTEDLPTQKEGVTAQIPRFDTSLISIPDGHNATRYSDAVYSSKNKMLSGLGIEIAHREINALPSEDTKFLCKEASEYLLKRTEDCRAEYALTFAGMLSEKLNSKFKAMESFLCHELETIDDA